MGGEEQQQPAADEQAGDREDPLAARQPHDPAHQRWRVLELFRLLGRQAMEQRQISDVETEQDHRVEHPERALDDDPHEVEERRDQADHLGGVLGIEIDAGQPTAVLLQVPRDGVDDVNGRPAEAGQQPQRAGEIGGHERDVALPCDHRLDRELRQHLDPGEQREREPLRDEELGRLGAPRDDECRCHHRWKRPDRLERGAAGFVGSAGIDHGAAGSASGAGRTIDAQSGAGRVRRSIAILPGRWRACRARERRIVSKPHATVKLRRAVSGIAVALRARRTRR